ncbi:hypothetical protein N3K66_005128 [Trichothecium roseum]|uniref:Uncharacterized protein n=1 Tax=Trichothecium roseum TaxID=47278 RepID=A0ACC0V3Y6_9HYPO|nr:hypothetical protein N3K66_005128 [Trichothecium roseum]
MDRIIKDKLVMHAKYEKNAHVRAEELWQAFHQYASDVEEGNTAAEPPRRPLKLLPSMEVRLAYRVNTKDLPATTAAAATPGPLDGIRDILVTRIGDQHGVNFVGFEETQGAMVFRGQRRHFDKFVNYVVDTWGYDDIEVAFMGPAQIHYKPDQFGAGISFQEFRDHIEVVDCAIWKKGRREEASLTYDPLTDENGRLVSDLEQAWLDANQNSLTNEQAAEGEEKEEMPEASFFDDAFFEPSPERELPSEKPQDLHASYGLDDPPGLDELCRAMEARKAKKGKGNDEPAANDDHDRHLYYYPRPENPSRILLVDRKERGQTDAERKGSSSSRTRADETQTGPVPETHQQSHASSGSDSGAPLSEQVQFSASSSSNAGVHVKQGSPFSEVHLGLPFDQDVLDIEEELRREANADFGGDGVSIREESTSGEESRVYTMDDFSMVSRSATTPASCPRNEDDDDDEPWFLPPRKRRRMTGTTPPTHGDGRTGGQ